MVKEIKVKNLPLCSNCKFLETLTKVNEKFTLSCIKLSYKTLCPLWCKYYSSLKTQVSNNEIESKNQSQEFKPYFVYAVGVSILTFLMFIIIFLIIIYW